MNRISLKAVAIAFFAETAADMLRASLLFGIFAQSGFSSDMSDEEMRKVAEAVAANSDYLLWTLVLGTATTVGGAYLAARIARKFPYYNGLAMGIAGILVLLIFWSGTPTWLNVISLLITIPASIYGAHIAKQHMSAVP
jgi:MFS family permease